MMRLASSATALHRAVDDLPATSRAELDGKLPAHQRDLGAALESSDAGHALPAATAPDAPMTDAAESSPSSANSNPSSTPAATTVSTVTPDEDDDNDNLANPSGPYTPNTQLSPGSHLDSHPVSETNATSQDFLSSTSDYDHDLADLILEETAHRPELFDYGDDDIDMSDSEGGAPLSTVDPLPLTPFLNVLSIVQLLSSQDGSPSPALDNGQEETGPAPIYIQNHPYHLPPQVFQTPGTTMDGAPPPGAAPQEPPNNNAPPLNQAANAEQTQQPADPLGPAPNPSNPNPTVFGGLQNLGLINFLRSWAYHGVAPSSLSASFPPNIRDIRHLASQRISEVRYDDLRGDTCDMQGVDWAGMGLSRQEARRRRLITYQNYVNISGSDRWNHHFYERKLKPVDDYFRFRRMLIRPDGRIAHFQLRNYMACPTRTSAYYLTDKGLNHLDTVSGRTEIALATNLTAFPVAISTLDANHGALMAGTFKGEYYIKNLNSVDDAPFSNGQITDQLRGITNHLQIHLPRRSSSPLAAIASNDCGFRVMDLATEKFTMQAAYPFPINNSAVSPDRRLRVIVGDNTNAFVVDADTGHVQQELTGHRDFGFACDWSDDGWTVATGFQDMSVKIWDARRWSNVNGASMPVCTIRSEMAGVRNLRFSPTGSGPRVLVAAEEADYINIMETQTYSTKQTIDLFGEIGGVGFTNEGQELNVFCADPHRGGFLQLERCGAGPEPFYGREYRRQPEQLSYHGYRWRADRDDTIRMEEDYRRNPTLLDTVPIF